MTATLTPCPHCIGRGPGMEHHWHDGYGVIRVPGGTSHECHIGNGEPAECHTYGVAPDAPMSGSYVLMGIESEERVADPETGGEKGRKLAQLGALDPAALYVLAEVAGSGANKYSAHNYLRGYAWSLSYDALQRHLLKFQMGEDLDAESGLPHLGHAAWHCLALLSFLVRGLGTDDRPPALRGTRLNPPASSERTPS